MRRPVAWVGAALPLLAGLASCTADAGEGASPSPTPVVAPADYAQRFDRGDNTGTLTLTPID